MKLNIGSGSCNKSTPFAKDSNWVNVDIGYNKPKDIKWDAAEYMNFDLLDKWPIEDDSVDCIFASHVFEHFKYDKVLSAMQQAFRALKVGHPIRIICPDPRKFWNNWQLKNDTFVHECYGEKYYNGYGYKVMPNIGFTDMFFPQHYDHQLISSIDLIAICAIRASFSQVYEMNFSCTKFPEYFGSLDNTIDNRPLLSWYLECIK